VNERSWFCRKIAHQNYIDNHSIKRSILIDITEGVKKYIFLGVPL